MAGIVGFKPTVAGIKGRCLSRLAISQYYGDPRDVEPVIAAVKGLCPNHLDERTVWQGRSSPCILSNRVIGNEDIINTHMQQCSKGDKIIYSRQRSAVLPLVNGLRGIEAEMPFVRSCTVSPAACEASQYWCLCEQGLIVGMFILKYTSYLNYLASWA